MGIPAVGVRKRHDDARHHSARHAAQAARAVTRAGVVALLATALLAPAASAQLPTPTPTPIPVPTPTPVPTPVPAQGKLRLKLEKVHRDGPRRIALTRDQWRVRGEMRPYVAGQTVLVRFFRDGRKIHQQVEQLEAIRGGTAGRFLTPYRARKAGRISVQAVHLATPEIDTVRSDRVRVNVLKPAGTSRPIVRLLQKGLAKLHYSTSRSGVYDDATARSVMAWRKVTGMARTFSPSEAVVRGVLAGRGSFKVKYPRDGHHVEADLSRQVLALIDRDKVKRIYHISSGKPSTPTVLGRFHVYRKSPGTNSHGMVHSSYFIGGYAMHGYADVPTYPASHGCLRLPIPSAWSIYSWVRMGDIVDVYP